MKIIAVLGATGTQGSSVVKCFASEGGWKIRALTRNTASSKATKLTKISPDIELVQADTSDVESLKRAFEGCTAIFAVTDYWAPFFDKELRTKHAVGPSPGEALRKWAYEDELRHGRNISDAAATVGEHLTHFIWSGLPSPKKYSKGKYLGIYHFDSKAAITEYVKENQPELAKKMSVIYISFYASNMLVSALMRPIKKQDGSFLVQRICPADAKHPFIITDQDTGPFTKALVEEAPGKTLLAYTAMLSWSEMAQIFGKVFDQKVEYRELTLEEFKKLFPVEGEELLSATYSAEFGYAGRDPDVIEPEALGFESRSEEIEAWMRKQDWSAVLDSKPGEKL